MKKKFYRPLFYQLSVLIRAFFSLFPPRAGFSFGGSMGKFIFFALRDERNKTLGHLRLAFGTEKSERELRRVGQSVFEHYGKTLAECFLIEKIIPRFDKWVSVSGYEHFDKALKRGKGIVVVIAHFGNWELMGGFTAMKGYPCTVIARKIYYEKYDEFMVSLRKRMNVHTIYRDESIRSMLNVLHKNGLLGFVVDQDVDSVDGTFVNFFNRLAYTPIAPVRFALAAGAPIIPVFIVRTDMRHHMFVEPPIEITQGADKEDTIRINTQKWVAVQEKYIRQYPHLWVWNHERWKTQLNLMNR